MLEVMMATVISSGVLAALFVFFIPWVNVFTTLISNNDYRTSLIGLVDTIEKEASEQMTIYVDSGRCYQFCMVDDVGNRTYYYYDQANTSDYRSLFRKKESVTQAIACTGGKTVGRNIKVSSSSFANTNSLFSVKMAGVGDRSTSNPFSIYNVIFPAQKERKFLFTEGFECNSLASGWTVNSGANSTWSVSSNNSNGYGKYLVVDTQTGTGSNTSSIEVPVDLARVSSAMITFTYFSDGTIGIPDTFAVDYYNGSSWTNIHNHNTGGSPAALTITKDLSGYGLSSASRVKFSGTLQTTGAHWYVDGIQIYNP